MSEAATVGKVIRMGGEVTGTGDGRLTDAMSEGLAAGRSRAEMRQKIDEQAAEIARLRAAVEERDARLEALNARLREVEVSCRIQSAILHADRSGRLEGLERRWKWERRRTAERVTNAVMPWVWMLAAFWMITTQIMRVTGRN